MSHMIACSFCGGDGVRRARPSKRALHEHRTAVAAASEGAPPSPPSPRRLPCAKCDGVGLVGLAAGAALPPLSDAVVAVVGGGIGGAAVALALQQRGIAVRVYERDGSFSQRAQGYGLTMQQGAHALRRLGLENSGVFSVAHRSFLPDGTAIGGYGRALHASTRDALGNGRGDAQRRNAHIPRQALRKSLVDALRPGTIAWGRALRSFDADADGGGVTLHLDDTSAAPGAPPPPPERAALLVGADGIYSAVRTQLLGDAAAADTQKDPPLRYLGVVVVLGRAPCDHPLAKEQVFQTLDGTTRVYCMPFVDGVSMWQLSFRLSEAEARAMPRDGASLRAEALRRVGGWHAPLPQLVADTRPEDVTGYPAYDRDPLPSSGGALGGGRAATLLGDAAHPMSPFKGQGANQALLDAVGLACAVRRAAPFGGERRLADCLGEYEDEMRRRSVPKVLGSRDAAEQLHSEQATAPSDCTRAAAARAAGAEAG